jgi:hypothetical protein
MTTQETNQDTYQPEPIRDEGEITQHRLTTNSIVFAAMLGVNTHPQEMTIGGRRVSEEEEKAEGNKLREILEGLKTTR